jgi:hypothetical protein
MRVKEVQDEMTQGENNGRRTFEFDYGSGLSGGSQGSFFVDSTPGGDQQDDGNGEADGSGQYCRSCCRLGGHHVERFFDVAGE